MNIQDILDRKNEFYVKFFQWNTYTIDKFYVLIYLEEEMISSLDDSILLINGDEYDLYNKHQY